MDWIGMNLFYDDTCSSEHISRQLEKIYGLDLIRYV